MVLVYRTVTVSSAGVGQVSSYAPFEETFATWKKEKNHWRGESWLRILEALECLKLQTHYLMTTKNGSVVGLECLLSPTLKCMPSVKAREPENVSGDDQGRYTTIRIKSEQVALCIIIQSIRFAWPSHMIPLTKKTLYIYPYSTVHLVVS